VSKSTTTAQRTMSRIVESIPPTDDALRLVTDSRDFQRLSPQQKTFVLVLLKTGDSQQAVDAAYPSAHHKSRRALKYQVLRSGNVTAALDVWRFRDSGPARANLIRIVQEQLKAAEPGSTSAAKFTVQLERLLLGVQGTNKAHFKDLPEPEDDQASGEAVLTSRVPAGATPLVDDQGIVRGYKTEAGDYVQLADVEAQ
jgi:hypothetical protein